MLSRLPNNRKMRRFRMIVTFGLGLAMVLLASTMQLTSGAMAQDPSAVTDDEVNEVAKQLYCPVCENIPLDVCPTQACAQWRDLIRLKLSEGWSAEQVKIYFADQYGERVLATPRAKGFNWLLIPVPILAFAVGSFILIRALKSLTRSQPGASGDFAGEDVGDAVPQVRETAFPPANQLSAADQDDYIKRVEEELRKR